MTDRIARVRAAIGLRDAAFAAIEASKCLPGRQRRRRSGVRGEVTMVERCPTCGGYGKRHPDGTHILCGDRWHVVYPPIERAEIQITLPERGKPAPGEPETG